MTTVPARRVAEPLDEVPEKPYYKRWWFVPVVAAGILVGMFVLAVVALLVSWRMSHYAALKKVEAEVARIQAAGEPITAADMHAYHKVPASKPDITQAWLRALNALDENALNSSGQSLPFVGEGDAATLDPAAPGGQLVAAGQLLQDYAAPLGLIHEAASLQGECRFPVNFDQGIAMLLPHAQEMRSVQRLLQLEARVKFHRGDVDGALTSIDQMLNAAQSLDHQMTLVEQLVCVALYSMSLSEIEFLVNATDLTEPQLARLQQRLAGCDLSSGLPAGMLGERGLGYNTFQHVNSLADIETLNGTEGPDWEPSADGAVGRPADCLKYLELMGEMVEASREPFPAARQKVTLVEQKLKTLAGTRNPLEKLKYLVTSLLMPATGSVFDAFARVQARRDCLVAAIAAERFRLQTGLFPTRLNDLNPGILPAVPTDPFSGKPLLMKTGPGEAIVYSVGINGNDDQGVETENRGEPDIVVRVEAAKGSAVGDPSQPK